MVPVMHDLSDLYTLPKLEHIEKFGPGDNVVLNLRVIEGENERLQAFQGNVIKGSLAENKKPRRGDTFTVRRVTYGVGVERTIPFYSTNLESLKVVRRGKVRRARIYYLSKLSGKKARIKERR